MACNGGTLLSLLLLFALWEIMSCRREDNPESVPECQGTGFHECVKMMNNFSYCDNQSGFAVCATNVNTELKQLECNDHQRKSAKRLVAIYNEVDKKLCGNDSLNIDEICWGSIQRSIIMKIFGFGKEPCIIREASYNASIKDLTDSKCDPQIRGKFFTEILEIADCKNYASALLSNIFLLSATLLATFAILAIEQR